ncbi:hypothetical protein J3R83DRAFT_13266 [Lanmaoa asiatica]|nr:hypothetical protein J3R83DRAFT_13266 [Lanmaoa asiatica]
MSDLISTPSQTQSTVSNETFEALIDLIASDGIDENPSTLPGDPARRQPNTTLRDPSGKLDFDKIRLMFAAQNESHRVLGEEKNRVLSPTVPTEDGDSDDETHSHRSTPSTVPSRSNSMSPKPTEHATAAAGHRRSSTFGNQPWAAIHENATAAKVVSGLVAFGIRSDGASQEDVALTLLHQPLSFDELNTALTDAHEEVKSLRQQYDELQALVSKRLRTEIREQVKSSPSAVNAGKIVLDKDSGRVETRDAGSQAQPSAIVPPTPLPSDVPTEIATLSEIEAKRALSTLARSLNLSLSAIGPAASPSTPAVSTPLQHSLSLPNPTRQHDVASIIRSVKFLGAVDELVWRRASGDDPETLLNVHRDGTPTIAIFHRWPLLGFALSWLPGTESELAPTSPLRVLRLSDPEDTATTEQKSAVGHGGHRVDLSKNLWDGSGLKIESASTDVAWCSGSSYFFASDPFLGGLRSPADYNNKILTSARNGDLIMWDLDKPGSTKYERKTKNHIRSIHKLSCSSIVPYYCITGSADGDMRIWVCLLTPCFCALPMSLQDLRDMSRSVMKIHHPTSVRSLVFSPSLSHPLQAVVGLDNGSIYRWDLQMGQRGQLDRLPVAHTGPILALDWCSTPVTSRGADNVLTQMERSWIVSGGLDHTVKVCYFYLAATTPDRAKVWDLPESGTSSHIVNKPTYVLHPSYPVRRVLWRPEYPCELALVPNAEFSGSNAELLASPRMQNATPSFLLAAAPVSESKDAESKLGLVGETVEIWDVRRGWIAKWTVDTSVSEGGVTDAVFRDSHALFVQHASGTFAQIDLRDSHRPIDAVPRVALSWNAVDGSEGALAFVAGKCGKWEVPYDDIHPDRLSLLANRRSRLKALGDKSRIPSLQNMGMYVHSPPSENTGPDVFARLAKGYVVPEKPTKKKEVCALNAEVAIQAGNVHAAQVWILLESLLMDIVPESVSASSRAPIKIDLPHPLVHSASAPGALPSNEGASVHSAGPASKPASYRAMSADSATHPVASPLHSPSQSRVGHHHSHVHTPRSASVSGASPAKSASNEDRKHLRHRPEAQPPPPTKPPPNSRNLTPVSSASSSPRHVPVALPPTPVLPPTTTMTPTTAGQRRPSILVPTTSPLRSHARRPSVYNRVTSAHSESPSAASVSDRSLRHVGEGALDDSDSSDGVASESIAESHAGEIDHIELASALPNPKVTKARSMSAGRAGPAYPSPLSRLAGQQQWTEEEGVDTGPGPGLSKLRAEDDDGSPSPVSSDTDGERSDDSEGEVRHRVVTIKSRSRSRKNSVANARRLKSRDRSSTVASLAAPLLSPARSSPSRPPTGSPGHVRGVIGGRESQSSVETVIAASIREQESEVAPVDSGKDLAGDKEPASWAEMSHQQKVAVVDEEHQLREAGWRALREALEEYADEVGHSLCFKGEHMELKRYDD